jgi:hypothetical protein
LLGQNHPAVTTCDGAQSGAKLSATQGNSQQLRSPESGESHRVRLDRSGWGRAVAGSNPVSPITGKSCSWACFVGPYGRPDGEQTGKILDGIRRRRGAPLGCSASSEDFEGAKHPAQNRVVAG